MRRIVLVIIATIGSVWPGWAQDTLEPAHFTQARQRMVTTQIAGRGIRDSAVLSAMAEVPRHLFIPANLHKKAYADHPLPIGEGQTISQPYIVALMTAILGVSDQQRILEIGTGSGYQTAVLAELAGRVYSLEIKPGLHRRASELLNALEYGNIHTRQADGYYGWPQAAPFDGIMITAAVDHIPPPLLLQLKEGGQLVMPLGSPFGVQNLVRVTRHGRDHTVEQICGVLFVPMTGRALKGQ